MISHVLSLVAFIPPKSGIEISSSPPLQFSGSSPPFWLLPLTGGKSFAKIVDLHPKALLFFTGCRLPTAGIRIAAPAYHNIAPLVEFDWKVTV